LGIRLGTFIAILISVAGFAVYGSTHSYIGYLIAAALTGFTYSWAGMVPVSLAINRWFTRRRALALGICSAGSGIASIVTPPAVTFLIQTFSLRITFYIEAGFLLIMAVIALIVICDRPSTKGMEPYGGSILKKITKVSPTQREARKSIVIAMLVAVFLCGVVSNTAVQHVAILFKSSGYNAGMVSILLSIMGLALAGGKFVYGAVTDKIGGYKSSYIFFGLEIAGLILCCFAWLHSMALACFSVFILAMGFPLATVGLTVFARDMSSPDKFAQTVKNYQIAYMIGGFTFSPMPGIIDDHFGSYIPAFSLMSFLAIIMAFIILRSYALYRQRTKQIEKGKHAGTGGQTLISDSQ
jgi:predicted MFS family arabinose efflux permease